MALPGKVRMVRGPASVKVKGKCTVLGADVTNALVAVRANKALPFEPDPNCRLRVSLGNGASAWWASRRVAGTLMWQKTCRYILSELDRLRDVTVLVVGDVDTGKSTFCTYLANTALNLGIISCIIDGDIGQGDIVPPSAIGSTIINQAVTDLRDATATHFGFVGSISPAGIESLIIKTMHRLSESSCGGQARLQIINTDGYIDNGGLHYKRQMADEIQPDVVVMLGRSRLLANAIGSSDWTFLRTSSSTQANKSWTDRRWRRHDQFVRFVGNGQIFANTDEKIFRYLGNPIPLSDISSLLLIDPLWLKDVFVGLGRNEVIAGFGLIKNIDKNHVELRSDLREFDTIHLTNIRIGADMAEQITLEIPDQVPREN